VTVTEGEGSVRTWAPGRVNLIGDHTDHAGGLAMPMAIDRGTTVRCVRSGRGGSEGPARVQLWSSREREPADVPLDVDDPAAIEPRWARYVGGVVHELAAQGAPLPALSGRISTTLPLGAGLSSSAALEVAVALALGFTGSPLELAKLCRRAEHRATGVPCGLMDQWTSVAGVAGHALLLDFTAETLDPVPIPHDVVVVVVPTGETRALTSSPYRERTEQSAAAAREVGPLADARLDDLAAIDDPVVRRRARHVITENARVLAFAHALLHGDLATAGELMDDSHRSLRDDYEVSTTQLDELVGALQAQPGVLGARLTGAGFGGCAIALVEAGAADRGRLLDGWQVTPSAGAHLLDR
jgi:galactokinase